MRLNKNDRILLILLALAIGSFSLYSLLTAGDKAGTPVAPAGVPASDTLGVAAAAADTTALPADTLVPKTLPKEEKAAAGYLTTSRYPGPPQYVIDAASVDKLSEGETIELNAADTLLLMRVPGVGRSFARRIYAKRLEFGGYYAVEQLQEIPGMDRERYDRIAPYFTVKIPPRKIFLSADSISRHPYLQYRHVNVIRRHLLRGDSLSWPLLMQSGAFTRDDSLRLVPYLPI